MAKKKDIFSRLERRIRHGDSDVHDLCLQTRKVFKINLNQLSSLWGGNGDAREYLALFLLYNKPSLSFLSIEAKLAEDGTQTLIFEPKEKIGCAPLYSPINGKVCSSIIVTGNLKEDISEILPLIDDDVEIKYSDKLILPFKSSIKPPIYFECAKYLDQYIIAQRLHWKKFISEERIEHSPSSSTQWGKYATKSYDPNQTLKYPNKKNLLSVNHTEWRELNFVLKKCLDELCNIHTPLTSRRAYKTKVEDLRRKTDLLHVDKPTELKIRTSDPIEIKKLKEIGNRIINSITSEYRAWNVNFSKLFESYVQYIFKRVAFQIGGQSYSNNKLSISGPRRNWGLAYLEPDIIIRKANRVIVADAKYKMHLLNSRSESVDKLKDAFRHDLHQVLAYSSFESEKNKTAIIVYPNTSFISLNQKIRGSIMPVTNNLYIVGIPWGECREGDTMMSLNEKVARAVDGIVQIVLGTITSELE